MMPAHSELPRLSAASPALWPNLAAMLAGNLARIIYVIDALKRSKPLKRVAATRATDASDMAAKPFTNLYGKRADATHSPDDEHMLSGLHTATVPKPLQSRDIRDRNRSRLLKAQPLRLGSQLGFLAASELSKCSLADAEHRIARLETRDSWAKCYSHTCHIRS
jgi:hypothetical protein